MEERLNEILSKIKKKKGEGIADKFEKEASDYIMDIIKKLHEYSCTTFSYHYRQEDIDEIEEEIPLFAEVTSEPYDVRDYRRFLIEKFDKFVEETGVEKIKKTAIYEMALLRFPEIKEMFSRESIIKQFFSFGEVQSRLTTEQHKQTVYMSACNACLDRKDTTLKEAIMEIIKNEEEGIPVYRQDVNISIFDEHFTEEVKNAVDFIKEHDTEIFLYVLTNL